MQPSLVDTGRSFLASSTVGRIGSLGTLAWLIRARAPGSRDDSPESSLPLALRHARAR